jgi:hypothetical protein
MPQSFSPNHVGFSAYSGTARRACNVERVEHDGQFLSEKIIKSFLSRSHLQLTTLPMLQILTGSNSTNRRFFVFGESAGASLELSLSSSSLSSDSKERLGIMNVQLVGCSFR